MRRVGWTCVASGTDGRGRIDRRERGSNRVGEAQGVEDLDQVGRLD